MVDSAMPRQMDAAAAKRAKTDEGWKPMNKRIKLGCECDRGCPTTVWKYSELCSGGIRLQFPGGDVREYTDAEIVVLGCALKVLAEAESPKSQRKENNEGLTKGEESDDST